MGWRRVIVTLALCSSVLLLSSCLARRRVITRKATGAAGAPAPKLLTANLQQLLERIEMRYQSIQTLNATVDMVPAVGSVNKGKITEYKDIRAYVLYRKPADIRIIGLYPVVRNKAFDMTSNGGEFRLYIPSKNRFITGRNEIATPSPNKLENLRPSVFLDALLVAPVNAETEIAVLENLTDEDNAVYIVHVLTRPSNSHQYLKRSVWFDRLTLHISRQIILDQAGDILTDVRYSSWKTYDNVLFPSVIDINRPKDEYGVVINVVKAEINKPMTNEKFALERPEGSVLQVLGSGPPGQPAPERGEGSSASGKKTEK